MSQITNASHVAQSAKPTPVKPSTSSTSTSTSAFLSRGLAPHVLSRSKTRLPMRVSSAPRSPAPRHTVTAPHVVARPRLVRPVALVSALWRALAKCESTSRWHLVSGNGFYGGLQFTPSTWASFGGLRYASNAAAATPQEQVTIAQKVQRVQGWIAWPVCAHLIGLR